MKDEARTLLELITEAGKLAERQGESLVAYFLSMAVSDLEGAPDAPQVPQTRTDRRRRSAAE